MSYKWFFSGLFFFSLVALIVLGILIVVPAQAQCGDNPKDSSCITCHEYQGEDPVYGKGEWHTIHASKDCCWNCHGGNTQAQDKVLAHIGLTINPLQDIYTDCHSCHPDDYPERAVRFASVLGEVPGSAPTPTALAAGLITSHPIILQPLSSTKEVSFPWVGLLIGGGLLGLFFIALIFLGRVNNSKQKIYQ
jgi:hypothetical protein